MPLPSVRVRSVSTTRRADPCRDRARRRARRRRSGSRSARRPTSMLRTIRPPCRPDLGVEQARDRAAADERARPCRPRSRAAPRPSRRSPSARRGRAACRSRTLLAGGSPAATIRSGPRCTSTSTSPCSGLLARVDAGLAGGVALADADVEARHVEAAVDERRVDASALQPRHALAVQAPRGEAQLGVDRRRASSRPPSGAAGAGRSPPAATADRAAPAARPASAAQVGQARPIRSSAGRARGRARSPRVQLSSPARSVAPSAAVRDRRARSRPGSPCSVAGARRSRFASRRDAARGAPRTARATAPRARRGHRRADRGRCRRAGRRSRGGRRPRSRCAARAETSGRSRAKVSTSPVVASIANGTPRQCRESSSRVGNASAPASRGRAGAARAVDRTPALARLASRSSSSRSCRKRTARALAVDREHLEAARPAIVGPAQAPVAQAVGAALEIDLAVAQHHELDHRPLLAQAPPREHRRRRWRARRTAGVESAQGALSMRTPRKWTTGCSDAGERHPHRVEVDRAPRAVRSGGGRSAAPATTAGADGASTQDAAIAARPRTAPPGHERGQRRLLAVVRTTRRRPQRRHRRTIARAEPMAEPGKPQTNADPGARPSPDAAGEQRRRRADAALLRDDDEDPWRHAPVAPVDEDPLKSLAPRGRHGRATVTGADRATSPTKPDPAPERPRRRRQPGQAAPDGRFAAPGSPWPARSSSRAPSWPPGGSRRLARAAPRLAPVLRDARLFFSSSVRSTTLLAGAAPSLLERRHLLGLAGLDALRREGVDRRA